VVVVLTPGANNSAYFEHAFLAQQMCVELVEGQDLFVRDGFVFMRTTRGPQRVDVIYRRIDDDFLDPLVFRPDSVLGVPGLMAAYRAGRVTVANAMGTGIADDKSIYPYVPEMIRFYLGEEPILANVATYQMSDPDMLEWALGRLDRLVVKPTAESGGTGVFIGPVATDAQAAHQAELLRAAPHRWIAQDVVRLSTVPTVQPDGTLEPRHVDLRPFAVFGEEISVIPGGLTRVALPAGEMIVNSSKGGGSKDTWVLEDDPGRAGPTPTATLSPPPLPGLRTAGWVSQQQQQQQRGDA
jgi:uncharacterized circularly permuted ATP-grasp superfamily protein